MTFWAFIIIWSLVGILLAGVIRCPAKDSTIKSAMITFISGPLSWVIFLYFLLRNVADGKIKND